MKQWSRPHTGRKERDRQAPEGLRYVTVNLTFITRVHQGQHWTKLIPPTSLVDFDIELPESSVLDPVEIPFTMTEPGPTQIATEDLFRLDRRTTLGSIHP